MNDSLVALITFLSQLFGGSLGCAIIVLSLGVRIALLPLTIKLARRASRNQRIIQALQPEIEALKKHLEKKPELFFAELRKLYEKHDCRLFDLPALLASFVQLPVFGILYHSIQTAIKSSGAFVWIRNLAVPDFYLTLAILVLTGLTASLMPGASDQMKIALIIFQLVVTFLIVWKLAAGLGLYWASSSAVSLFQTFWLRYRDNNLRAYQN